MPRSRRSAPAARRCAAWRAFAADPPRRGRLLRLRAAYGARRDAVVEGLPETLPEGSTWTRPEGGMFVRVRLPDGWDADALLADALERDVAFVPGRPFYAGEPDRATLRLSFTAHPPVEILAGLERLGSAVRARSAAAA